MRKRMAGVALAASLLAAVPVSPAQAEEGCDPPTVVCTVVCLALWTKDFVFGGGVNPGYTCAEW